MIKALTKTNHKPKTTHHDSTTISAIFSAHFRGTTRSADPAVGLWSDSQPYAESFAPSSPTAF